MGWALGAIDRTIDAVIGLGKWFALPIALCLFLQWPLRDAVQHFSREANDLGQVLFAFYVAISVTAATRRRAHLAVDALARSYSERSRRLLIRLGALFGLMPWALFVLFAGRHVVLNALELLERFAETGNPGYFLIKLALWLLGVLVLAQGVLDLLRPRLAAGAA